MCRIYSPRPARDVLHKRSRRVQNRRDVLGWTHRLWLARVAAALFAASAIWLGAGAEHLAYPLASGIYKGALAAATTLIGAFWLARRPDSRLGYWLIAFAVAF